MANHGPVKVFRLLLIEDDKVRMNSTGSAHMAASLLRAGFEVTRIPMDVLNREKFTEWVEEAYALWEDTL